MLLPKNLAPLKQRALKKRERKGERTYSVPTVPQLRGKLLILRRSQWDFKVLGFLWRFTHFCNQPLVVYRGTATLEIPDLDIKI